MKQIIKLLTIMFISMSIMTGCNKKEKGLTTDLNLHQSAPGFFTETEYGYYFNYDGFFYYSDKDNINFRKLCNKPNCSHNDQNCNAYNNYDCYTDTNFSNGRIYYFYNEIDKEGNPNTIIESKNPDGSNTKKEKAIKFSYGYFSGKMHRNYFIYNTVIEENGQQNSKLFLQDLEKLKKDPEIICEISCDIEERNPYIFVDAIVSDFIYYTIGEKKYRYDIVEKETIETPLEVIMRKGIYYTENEILEVDLEENYRKINLKDGTVTNLPLEKNPEEQGPIFFDDTYMYRINYTYGPIEVPKEKEGIFIYDMDGTYITFIPYSLPTNNEMMFVAAKDKVFLFRIPDMGRITTYSYFDKSEIESGAVNWIDVEME